MAVSNQTLLKDTDIWISCNFHVSQSTILQVIFTNVKTIWSSQAGFGLRSTLGLKLWRFPLTDAGIQHRGPRLEDPPGWPLASGTSGTWDPSIRCSPSPTLMVCSIHRQMEAEGLKDCAGGFPGQPGGVHIASSQIPLVTGQAHSKQQERWRNRVWLCVQGDLDGGFVTTQPCVHESNNTRCSLISTW